MLTKAGNTFKIVIFNTDSFEQCRYGKKKKTKLNNVSVVYILSKFHIKLNQFIIPSKTLTANKSN